MLMKRAGILLIDDTKVIYRREKNVKFGKFLYIRPDKIRRLGRKLYSYTFSGIKLITKLEKPY